MGYMHIDNLYKSQDILLFKECYALEKVHGTSARVSWRSDQEPHLSSTAGGCTDQELADLFDEDALLANFAKLGHTNVTVYGEAYGANVQGMSDTYGEQLRFIVFEVKIGDSWLAVPDMDEVASSLGFDVVPWRKVSTQIDALNAERDATSVVAHRRGCGNDKKREGIVLRPPIEVVKNDGRRIIAKYKTENFRETKSPRPVDPEKLKVLAEASAIAEEWVTEMRLSHVLDAFPDACMEQTGDVVRSMISDVEREAEGEIVVSKAARKAIGKRTAELFKTRVTTPLV